MIYSFISNVRTIVDSFTSSYRVTNIILLGDQYLVNDIVETGLVLIIIALIGMGVMSTNMILVLISIEMMLLGVNMQLVVYSIYFNDVVGQVFALIVLTVAAAEAAIGLGILVVYYRTRGGIDLNMINMLHG